jgi:hypothetical protein
MEQEPTREDLQALLSEILPTLSAAQQSMSDLRKSCEILLAEVTAWRALYFVDGSRLRTEAINDAVIATNKSGILKGMSLKGQELE